MGRGGPSQVCCSFLLVGEADPLPHDGSPSERSEGGGNNDTRPLRSHATRAPPGQALGSRQLSLAPAPSEPFAAPPARRKPPPRRLRGAGRLWREQPQLSQATKGLITARVRYNHSPNGGSLW